MQDVDLDQEQKDNPGYWMALVLGLATNYIRFDKPRADEIEPLETAIAIVKKVREKISNNLDAVKKIDAHLTNLEAQLEKAKADTSPSRNTRKEIFEIILKDQSLVDIISIITTVDSSSD